jgi:RNA polymerase sigma factor (sigma-70 family)
VEESQIIHFDELVERCKRGDSSAFTALYHRHAKEIYNSIHRLVSHTGESEDLLQESFVAAFQQIGKFEYRNTFAAWIKRIALNKAISHLRKKNIVLGEIEQLKDTGEGESCDEEEFSFRVEAVKNAIAQLPNGYRTVVLLHLIEGLSQEEVAKMMGISHNTVRTQYHRAKASLLKTLKKGGEYE